eukprot:1188723-Prorocentrum_minimum.AAC.4
MHCQKTAVYITLRRYGLILSTPLQRSSTTVVCSVNLTDESSHGLLGTVTSTKLRVYYSDLLYVSELSVAYMAIPPPARSPQAVPKCTSVGLVARAA